MEQPTIAETIAYIKQLYGDLPDKSGGLVYDHPIAVMHRLPEDTDVELKLAALLHDVLEDSLTMGTPVTADDLRARGYSERTVHAVEQVSKIAGVGSYQEGMGYLDWIKSIIDTGDVDALRVKYADVSENNSPERSANLPDADARDKVQQKYYLPQLLLRDAMQKNGLLPAQSLRRV